MRRSILCGTSAIIALGLLNTFPNCAQSLAKGNGLAFDVASVKVHQGGGGSTRRIEPDGITYRNITLGEFIQLAYGVKHHEIAAPDWIVDYASSNRYDVVAKTASPVSKEMIHEMLEPLLAERFHLTLHRETRELAVYALVVDKKGPKFKPGDGGPLQIEPDGSGGVSYHNYSMPALALALSLMRAVGRPVLDRTGLDGVYDLTEKFRDIPVGQTLDEVRRAAVENDEPLFAALQDQLGLKLESQKAPIEVLVIDHAEKVPTDN